MAVAQNKLSITTLVSVSVTLTQLAAQAQNLSTLLILDATNTIDTVEVYRVYTTMSQLAKDFPSGVTFNMAAAYFAQNPQPKQLIVGRWARVASPGGLRGGSGVSANKTIAQWQAVTAGAFTFTVDGGSPTNVTGLNFSAVIDYNGVAAVIDAALSSADCTYNASFDRFEFISHTTGITSSVSFLSAPGSGTDLSGSFTICGAGAAPADYLYVGTAGIAGGDKIVSNFDALIGRQWYAVSSSAQITSDQNIIDMATFLESCANKHVVVHTTQDATCLGAVGVDVTSLAYKLNLQGASRAFLQYSSTNAGAAQQSFARLMGVDYTGSNTAITLMYKQDPTMLPEFLNATQAGALQAKGCNVFVAYDNNTNILQFGQMSSGIFADQRHAADAIATNLETDLYNALYTNTTKIPQTDAGMHMLCVISEKRLAQFVNNGVSAPGIWYGSNFGTLNYGDFMSKGYYVYQGKVADQSIPDRSARKATTQQVAVKLAGAVHTINVQVTLNP